MTDTPAHTPLRLDILTGRDAAGLAWGQFIVRACNSHYQLVEALRGIIDHFDCSHGNAPGHDHLIPGVWDKDVSNGAKGGTQCVWCEQWNEARAALSQAGGASD